jgi:hypothetical protein
MQLYSSAVRSIPSERYLYIQITTHSKNKARRSANEQVYCTNSNFDFNLSRSKKTS